MSSKKVEDVHAELIKKLLIDSGLVCARSPRYSEESEEEEEEIEEGIEEEEAVPEEQFEAEHFRIPEEITPEEYTGLFPTPSLRRFIPERIRRIEAQNRIKVLPDQFNTDINPEDIPRIIYTAPQVYIDKLAEITGCKKYKNSLAEYWFVDNLANLLRRAQEDDLDKPTQAILILWFCEWMKEMQQFDAASRERMMRRWRDNMLAAAKVIADDDFFPKPDEAGVYYKQETKPTYATISSTSAGAKSTVPKTETRDVEYGNFSYECAMKDLTKIIHYIYDLIGTDFQYDLVRSIFTFGPEYHLIHGPYQLEVPKRIYTVLKPKKETKPPKSKPDKPPPGAKGSKKKEPETEEYLALMQFIAASNKIELEKEELDRENWNQRNSILPLNFAVTPEFLDQYWPAPVEPPPPPVVVAVPEPKKSKKKK